MRRFALVGILVLAACSAPVAVPNASRTPDATASLAAEATPSPTPAITAAELAAAAVATVETGTIRMHVEVTFEGSTMFRDGVGIKGHGQASLGLTRQFSLDLNMQAFGLGAVDMIVDDRTMYMRGTAFERLTGRKRWLLIDLDSKHPVAAEFGSIGKGQNDSSLAVYFLHGVEGTIEFLGVEKMDGVVTDRYRARVNLQAALERVPKSARATLASNIADIIGKGIEPVLGAEVWVGSDGLIHRVRYEYTLTSEIGGGRMIGVFQLSDFGAPLDLGIPSPRDVVKLEDVVPPES